MLNFFLGVSSLFSEHGRSSQRKHSHIFGAVKILAGVQGITLSHELNITKLQS